MIIAFNDKIMYIGGNTPNGSVCDYLSNAGFTLFDKKRYNQDVSDYVCFHDKDEYFMAKFHLVVKYPDQYVDWTNVYWVDVGLDNE